MSAFDPHSVNLGFASMDPEKQREIASKGGHARGQQLHEQAEMRRELEAAGLHKEAEEVKPHVGFAAMDPQKQARTLFARLIDLLTHKLTLFCAAFGKQHEIASKGGHARGEQLHQQAELRHKLEDAGYHNLAERVKPHVRVAVGTTAVGTGV